VAALKTQGTAVAEGIGFLVPPPKKIRVISVIPEMAVTVTGTTAAIKRVAKHVRTEYSDRDIIELPGTAIHAAALRVSLVDCGDEGDDGGQSGDAERVLDRIRQLLVGDIDEDTQLPPVLGVASVGIACVDGMVKVHVRPQMSLRDGKWECKVARGDRWPVELHEMLAGKGMIEQEGASLTYLPDQSGPWLSGWANVQGFLSLRKWCKDQRVTVRCSSPPKQWAAMCEAAEDPTMSISRVAMIRDQFRAIEWGEPEYFVKADKTHIRIEFYVEDGWTMPDDTLVIRDTEGDVQVQLYAPSATRVGVVERSEDTETKAAKLSLTRQPPRGRQQATPAAGAAAAQQKDAAKARSAASDAAGHRGHGAATVARPDAGPARKRTRNGRNIDSRDDEGTASDNAGMHVDAEASASAPVRTSLPTPAAARGRGQRGATAVASAASSASASASASSSSATSASSSSAQSSSAGRSPSGASAPTAKVAAAAPAAGPSSAVAPAPPAGPVLAGRERRLGDAADDFPPLPAPEVSPPFGGKKKTFYAVAVGRDGPKVYTSWEAARAAVEKHPGAKHKSFATQAEAVIYLEQHGPARVVGSAGAPILRDGY
jgi:hypothetical protein